VACPGVCPHLCPLIATSATEAVRLRFARPAWWQNDRQALIAPYRTLLPSVPATISVKLIRTK
jgi:hypothetical protein